MQDAKTLLAAFLAADHVWHAEMCKLWGERDAATLRYTSAARGEEGTPLRAAYLARCEASDAWCNAKQNA